MLRINKLTDYALLIMGEMAKLPDVVQSASTLTETLHLSLPTVSKILKLLAEASLVESIRGSKGGYRIYLRPDNITLLQIMIAIEGPLTLTECCEESAHCHIMHRCLMRSNWMKINKYVVTIFDKITLFDMIHPLSRFDVFDDKRQAR